MKKIFLVIGVALFLLILYFIFPFFRPFTMEINITKIEEKLSPDEKSIAVIYSADGGATTSHNVFVRLMRQGEELNEKVLKNEDDDVFGAKILDPKIEVTWIDNQLLKIKCLNCESDNIFMKKDKWSEIVIKHE